MNVFFKMMQKDDKKEVLKFEIKGNEDGEAEGEMFDLSGSIVVLTLASGGTGIVENLPAEFMSMQRDSKKTAMKFAIKGDSEDQAQKLYKFAGRNVELDVKPSQMSLEDFHGDPEEDDEESADPAQLSLEEATQAAEQAAADSDDELEELPEVKDDLPF